MNASYYPKSPPLDPASELSLVQAELRQRVEQLEELQRRLGAEIQRARLLEVKITEEKERTLNQFAAISTASQGWATALDVPHGSPWWSVACQDVLRLRGYLEAVCSEKPDSAFDETANHFRARAVKALGANGWLSPTEAASLRLRLKAAEADLACYAPSLKQEPPSWKNWRRRGYCEGIEAAARVAENPTFGLLAPTLHGERQRIAAEIRALARAQEADRG